MYLSIIALLSFEVASNMLNGNKNVLFIVSFEKKYGFLDFS